MPEVTHLDPRRGVVDTRAMTLTVESGPNAGQRHRLDGPTSLTIGSGDGVDVRLADPMVSRLHARFTLGPDGVVLTDEQSRNGTWIGTTRVSRVVLTADTRVGIGESILAVSVDKDPTLVEIMQATRFGEAIGVSTSMRHLFAVLERASQSDIAILIEGESGCGKEVVARAVHQASPRAGQPFVTVDCSALPPTLVESELFGYERGAFTGAVGARQGLFAQADGGTVFLDEIGELPLDVQPKLLRVLELHEVRPVGATKARHVDVRVVAATNRNLRAQAESGTFRQDLFYRLAVACVRIPPLRDRPEDIGALADAFYRAAMKDEAALLPDAVHDLLRSYAWPGNARELRNVVQRYTFLGFSGKATLFGESETALGAAAPTDETAIANEAPSEWEGMTYHDARQAVLERFEEAYIPYILARAGGVITRAAELASVARQSFHRMVERLEARRRGST